MPRPVATQLSDTGHKTPTVRDEIAQTNGLGNVVKSIKRQRPENKILTYASFTSIMARSVLTPGYFPTRFQRVRGDI